MAFTNVVASKSRAKSFVLPINTQSAAGKGANGYISGIVTELGVVVSRRVNCYHRMSGILVSSVWSDNNGKYRFDGLIAGVKYYVTSLDSNDDAVQYNAVTQDLITASEAIK